MRSSGKTIQEAACDPDFYSTLYENELEDIRQQLSNFKMPAVELGAALHGLEGVEELKSALQDLEGFVGMVGISPLGHWEQLNSLQTARKFKRLNPLFSSVKSQFLQNLKEQTPEFLKKCFFKDSLDVLQTYHQHENTANEEGLKKVLKFYANVQDPVSYLENLDGLRQFVNLNKEGYKLNNDHLNLIVHLLNKNWNTCIEVPGFKQAVEQTVQDRVKAEQKRQKQEIQDQIGLEAQKNKPLLNKLAEGVYGVVKYAATHPVETFLFTVASQVSAAAAQTTVTLGTQFQIQSSLSRGTQSSSAGLANGNFVQTWPDNNNNIVARVFNGTTPATNVFNVSTSALSSQVTPQVAGLSGGNFFVTWSDSNTIFSRLFNPNGTAVTSPFTTNQITTYTNIDAPQVTALTNGDAFVAWSSSSGGATPTYNIPARIFGPDGTAATNEFNIVGPLAELLGGLTLTGLSDGDAFAAYAANSTYYGVTISPTGTVGSPVVANISGGTPSSASLTNGNVVVVYQKGFSENLGRIIQNGAPLGNEFIVRNGTTQVSAPLVASLSDSNFLVVFPALNATTISNDLYGIIFSSTGTPLTNEFSIPTPSAVDYPAIASLTSGDALVSWYDTNTIYGTTVSASTVTSTTGTPTSTTGTPTSTTGAPTSTTGTPTSTTGTPSSTTGAPTSTTGAPSSTTGAPTPTTGVPSPTGTPTSASSARSPSLWVVAGGMALYNFLANKMGY